MRLWVKVGTLPADYVEAPALKSLPKVGDTFEIRLSNQQIINVKLTEFVPIGKSTLCLLERW